MLTVLWYKVYFSALLQLAMTSMISYYSLVQFHDSF